MTTTPTHLQFVNQLKEAFDAAGIAYRKDPDTESGVVENMNWVNFTFPMKAGGEHKLYVPKNKRGIARLETTVFFDPRTVDGVLDLPSTKKRPQYRNGAIRSHLVADAAVAAKLMIEALQQGAPVPERRVTQQPQRGQQAESPPVREDLARAGTANGDEKLNGPAPQSERRPGSTHADASVEDDAESEETQGEVVQQSRR